MLGLLTTFVVLALVVGAIAALATGAIVVLLPIAVKVLAIAFTIKCVFLVVDALRK